MTALLKVEDGVVANPAVVVILLQMDVMIERDRFRISELEEDRLGFFGQDGTGD
jgi:hypothetical protein